MKNHYIRQTKLGLQSCWAPNHDTLQICFIWNIISADHNNGSNIIKAPAASTSSHLSVFTRQQLPEFFSIKFPQRIKYNLVQVLELENENGAEPKISQNVCNIICCISYKTYCTQNNKIKVNDHLSACTTNLWQFHAHFLE